MTNETTTYKEHEYDTYASQYCKCGQDVVTCQACGRGVCGNEAIYEGNRNYHVDCAPRQDALNIDEFNAVQDVITAKLAAGQKFTDADVTSSLAMAANVYAQRYTGTFDYMTEMRAHAVAHHGLTTGQARGVLNCMLAEARRNAQPQDEEVVDVSGIVRMLEGAREHLKFPKIRLMTATGTPVVTGIAGERARFPGSVNILSEKDEYGERQFFGRIHTDGRLEVRNAAPMGVADIIKAFAKDPEGVATAYGKLTGNCCFCGRNLEDERSTSVGYGPVCATRFGLAWGTRG